MYKEGRTPPPEKKTLTGKKWKSLQEEQQRSDPSPRKNMHAIDVVCAE